METNYLNDLPEFEENIESLNGSILSCIGKQYPALMILLPILMILIGILLGIASVYLKTILPITLFCVAVALAYSYFDAKARHAFMKQFARLNNYNYQQTGAIEKIDSPYLRIGYDRSISDIVAGTYQKYPIEFFNFGCTVGEGKTRRRINFTVAQINYNKPLMHIFLDARHNFFTEDSIISTEEPDTDKNCETIKLEGDFNKYFTLYAPAC